MKRLSSLVLLSCLALTACGGGGGSSVTPIAQSTQPPAGGSGATPSPAASSTPTSVPSSTPNPVPTYTSNPVPTSTPTAQPTQAPAAKVRQVVVQRALATQALQTQFAAQQAFLFGASSSTLPASGLRRTLDAVSSKVASDWHGASFVTRAPRAAAVSYGPCTNSVETAVVPVSATEQQIYERGFYDAACAQLYQDLFIDVAASGLTSASATGNDTKYTQAGAVTSYDTIAFSLDLLSRQLSLTLSSAPNATATADLSMGLSCGLATSASCGSGAVVRQQSASQDAGLSMSMNAASSSNGGMQLSLSGSATSYTGPLNALSISQQAFPMWSVSGTGMTTVDTVTFSGQSTFAANGTLAAGGNTSFTFTDAADDATVSLAISGSPVTVSGKVVQTSTAATIATFTVDGSGDGTITYSDGRTAQIVDWQVTG